MNIKTASMDEFEGWGEYLRDMHGAPQMDMAIHVKKKLEDWLLFYRIVAGYNPAPQIRGALFVPFSSVEGFPLWNRNVSLICAEIDALYQHRMGHKEFDDEEIARQWDLSGLTRP